MRTDKQPSADSPRSSAGLKPWRLLRTWNGAPGWNMSLDEALLLLAGPAPVLRFYTWSPDTLSLGYFQRWKDVPQRELASAVVRRTTGGGAIHHSRELTFSIAASLEHPLYRGAVQKSYERIHGALGEVFAELGVTASLRGSTILSSDDEASAMCFHRSTPIDLEWGGAKGVGSAQRRSRGRVLHHGSIKLGTTDLEGPIATLDAAGAKLDAAALADRVQAVFARRFGADFSEDRPTKAELDHAEKRADFFHSEEHLQRR
ncbi:MAG: lipoate-protein ligase A [Planctomycetota bacterium]